MNPICFKLGTDVLSRQNRVPGAFGSPVSNVACLASCGAALSFSQRDFSLLQREVAEIIGVTESSVWNREHVTEPELQYNPKIIKFLGYTPFACPDDTVGRLAWYKRAMGMNLDLLGEAMGRDPEQLSDWLSGSHNPFGKNRERIELFLGNQ